MTNDFIHKTPTHKIKISYTELKENAGCRFEAIKTQGEILINLCQNNKIKLRQEKFSKKILDY